MVQVAGRVLDELVQNLRGNQEHDVFKFQHFTSEVASKGLKMLLDIASKRMTSQQFDVFKLRLGISDTGRRLEFSDIQVELGLSSAAQADELYGQALVVLRQEQWSSKFIDLAKGVSNLDGFTLRDIEWVVVELEPQPA